MRLLRILRKLVWMLRSALRSSIVGFAVFAFSQLSWGESEALALGEHHWPTPNPAFVEHKGINAVVQPTVSGRIVSALFGCVRNDGHRFHEGVDLKALVKDRRGEPTDAIYAFEDGVVRYVNRVGGKSGYGQYIIIEHPRIAPGLVTLYAHLSKVPSSIMKGVSVLGGQEIATMGRTASYTIPRSRAHLHFEIAMWLGDDFQKWYDRQPYKSKNDHGSFNGMNLVGYPVWEILNALRSGEISSLGDFLAMEQPDLRVRIKSDATPAVLSANPDLMSNSVLPSDFAGWDIDFGWYGVPMKWTALSRSQMAGYDGLKINVLDFSELEKQPCAGMVRKGLIGGADSKLSSLLGRMLMN